MNEKERVISSFIYFFFYKEKNKEEYDSWDQEGWRRRKKGRSK